MSGMLATLVELQRLKRLDRTGWSLRGLPNGTESVGSHSFGVAVVAMCLADELVQQGVKLDVEKILRMALLHDWAEVRVGDMPKTATEYFGSETRRQAERLAFGDIISPLTGPGIYSELYDEYERRETLESKLVKAADILDLLIQVLAYERAGARGLNEFWSVADTADFKLDGVAKQTVEALVQSILKARGEFV